MNCDPCAIGGYRHDGRTVWVDSEGWMEDVRGREAGRENEKKARKEGNNKMLKANILKYRCLRVFPNHIWSVQL